MDYKQRQKEYECIRQHAYQAHEIINNLVHKLCYTDSEITLETKCALLSANQLLNAIYISSKKQAEITQQMLID